jgi:hypothetical protein
MRTMLVMRDDDGWMELKKMRLSMMGMGANW